MSLSLQQKKILVILSDNKPHKLAEFKSLYTNCNLYRALKYMIGKNYIKKYGNFYMITPEGQEVVIIHQLLKLFMFD